MAVHKTVKRSLIVRESSAAVMSVVTLELNHKFESNKSNESGSLHTRMSSARLRSGRLGSARIGSIRLELARLDSLSTPCHAYEPRRSTERAPAAADHRAAAREPSPPAVPWLMSPLHPTCPLPLRRGAT